jgi:hypothetical protein
VSTKQRVGLASLGVLTTLLIFTAKPDKHFSNQITTKQTALPGNLETEAKLQVRLLGSGKC